LLAAADLPELRELTTSFDDRAAAILAKTRNKPWLQRVVLTGHGLTDEGAIAIANATGLDRIALLWIVAPRGDRGRRDRAAQAVRPSRRDLQRRLPDCSTRLSARPRFCLAGRS
jgi:hypothetical protein